MSVEKYDADLLAKYGEIIENRIARALRRSSTARRMGHDDLYDVALDAAQEAVNTYKEGGMGLTAWVKWKITQAFSLAFRNARQRKGVLLVMDDEDLNHNSTEACVSEWRSELRLQDIEDAIALLAPPHRKAIEALIEGKTLPDMVKKFGWSNRQAAEILREARAELLARLES